MFFYGYYRNDKMKNSKGAEMPLEEFERVIAGRGAVFIAFCLYDPCNVNGWRHVIAGESVESLMDECQRFARLNIRAPMRCRWEMFRIDRKDFSIMEGTNAKEKELKGNQLTFG